MSMSYAFRRRSFLRGLGSVGAASGLGWWLHRAESWAEGTTPPKRLLVLHRPNGTIRDQWLDGAGAPGPILEPFADLADHMRVLDGLRLATFNGGEASHEGGLVTLMTGSPIGDARPPSPDDWKNTEPSLDQILALSSPDFEGVPFESLQIAAHNRQDGAAEVANRALSYSAADVPMYPEVLPSNTFQRLFGGIVPGMDAEAVARAKAKNASMLDFIDADLARLDALAPASVRPKLEAHADAIRALEQSLEGFAGCEPGTAPMNPRDPESNYFTDVEAVGKAQLEMLRTAMLCDLTRVTTFMWTPGASSVQFEGLYDGMPLVQHHSLSHQNLDASDVAQSMGAIDRWYSERTAEFLRSLRDTPDFDGSGSLLDNTLVLYITEVAAGTHIFEPMPLVLFGGAGVGLQAGPVASFDGRSTNDLWLAIAAQFGAPMASIGAEGQSSAPLEGLFG
jgi:hypothetical protein